MRRQLVALLLLLAALPAWPQSEPLGRLFTTPQQRSALDRERLLGQSQHPTGLDSEASYTFNGEVRRSSGKNTRWINGEPQATASRGPGVPAGDTFHPATGEHESVLGDGRIVIQRKPPTP
ncbi:MAG: hypothetical protein ACOYB3_06360 [Azonexus sp.]